MDVYESMLKNNEQVDIVNTGLGMSALGGYGDTFNLFVERGYLEPLNDYFQTDSGKAFYDGFDGIVWKQMTCADGMSRICKALRTRGNVVCCSTAPANCIMRWRDFADTRACISTPKRDWRKIFSRMKKP